MYKRKHCLLQILSNSISIKLTLSSANTFNFEQHCEKRRKCSTITPSKFPILHIKLHGFYHNKHCRLQILSISGGVEIGVWKWVRKLKNSFRFRNSTISSRCIVCSEFDCYSDKKKTENLKWMETMQYTISGKNGLLPVYIAFPGYNSLQYGGQSCEFLGSLNDMVQIYRYISQKAAFSFEL